MYKERESKGIASNNQEENLEKNFEYRSYTKGELAMLYMPNILQQSAVNQFNKWLHLCPGLIDRLKTCGWYAGQRRYTPEQVRIIVRALSEP